MLDASLTRWTIEADDSTFQDDIVSRSTTTPVVIDFWAPWCGPCRTLGPVLESLAAEYAGRFVLVKINVDEAQELAGTFRIEGIPAIRVIKDSKLVNGFDGLMPENELREFLDASIGAAPEGEGEGAPTPPTEDVAEVEKSDPARAEVMYREILAADANNENARLGLARLALAAGRDDEAAEMLAPLGAIEAVGLEAERLRLILELRRLPVPASADLPTVESIDLESGDLLLQLGQSLAKEGDYPAALEALIRAARTDKTMAKGPVRELMVKIFQVIGIRSELSDAYRDQLRGLLY